MAVRGSDVIQAKITALKKIKELVSSSSPVSRTQNQTSYLRATVCMSAPKGSGTSFKLNISQMAE